MENLTNLERPIDFDMSWSGVADTAAGAVALLARSGDVLRFLNRANVFCRFVLGRQLLIIQERHLWDQMERPISGGESEFPGPYHSWEDFMVHAFPKITGLSQKIGYAPMMLAKSPALRKLPETELKKFANLSHESAHGAGIFSVAGSRAAR